MDGPAVVAAYHDLYQVERSFRMAKTDLAARPVFHRLRDSIEAHLTVVFAALAVSREAQTRTGLSINKIVKPSGRCAPPRSPSAANRSPPNHESPPRPSRSWTTSLAVVTKPMKLRSEPRTQPREGRRQPAY